MKIILFISCFSPILFVLLFVDYFTIGVLPQRLSEIVAIGVGFVMVFGMIFVLFHIWKRSISRDMKILWSIVIVLFYVIMLPVYWFFRGSDKPTGPAILESERN